MTNELSSERKEYLYKKKKEKIIILATQILFLVALIALWEILANIGIIDSFITSQPSRILKTITNMSENNLLLHLGVTCFETIVGFILRNTYRNSTCKHFMVVRFHFKSCRTILSNPK